MTLSSPLAAQAAPPASTRAAVLHAAGDIRVEERALRTPGPGDVVVEMRSGGICGSDMHYFADGRNGQNELKAPTVLGHEGAGVVVWAGAEVSVEIGTPVVIEPAIPCGRCASCLAGRYNVCPTGVCFGSPPTDGLFARHVVAPASALHVLPVGISPEIGAVIEPVAVAVWANERGQVSAGQRVLVTGAGPIGLLVAQVALAQGAAEVVVTDVNDGRLAVASRLGASRVINTADAPLDVEGFDVLLECSGVVPALAAGIRALRPAGRATVVGQARPSVDGIPLGFLQRYEIDLVTAFRYANAFPTAIELVASGAVDVASIITRSFALDDVAQALVAPIADPSNLKVLVHY